MAAQSHDERERLLKAARTVLVRGGWWGFKVDSVAREAHLSLRSLYGHFRTKDELLLALLVANVDRLSADMWAMARSDQPGLVRLAAWVDSGLDVAFNPRRAEGALFARHWPDLHSRFPEALQRVQDSICDSLAHVLEDLGTEYGATHIDPRTDAVTIFQIVSGYNALALTGGAGPQRDQVRADILRFVVRSLLLVPDPDALLADIRRS